MRKLKSAYILLIIGLTIVKRGWPSIKVPISSLLLLPEVWDIKLTLNSTFLLPSGRSYHCSGLVFSDILFSTFDMITLNSQKWGIHQKLMDEFC